MTYFNIFSTEHILLMGIFTLVMIGLLFILQFLSRKNFLLIFSFFIVILKIVELIVRNIIYNQEILDLLPIHLCNLTLILCAINFYFKSNLVSQLIYYWFPGALIAILFPELRYSFPNFVQLSFFATHFFIIFTVLYQLIFLKFKPTLKGFLISFIYLNIFAGIVYKINLYLGTNYMYINYKPTFSSPLDFFGPWPNYIFIVELIYIVLGIISYLPFKKRNFKYYS